MLKVASLTERCVQTTLLHLASGLSVLPIIPYSSMPLGALNCRQSQSRPQLASNCPPSPRSLSSVCPDSFSRGSAREPSLRVSAASKNAAEVREAVEVKQKAQTTPRRARQVSCFQSHSRPGCRLVGHGRSVEKEAR